jgi:Ser/Thr protein kinase RdoA (MazF antagonist)
MHVEPAAIAALFGLGAPVGPLRPLPGRSGTPVWSLRTERGHWVVKLARPRGADGRSALDRASTLESAARAAGLATPRPVTPVDGDGYWVPVDGYRVRVFEYLDGVAPEVPLTGDLARWLGAGVATMAALALPAPPPVAPSTVDIRDLAPALRAAAGELRDLVRTALARPQRAVLLHGDINRHNILVTARGPVLLDFDSAAAQTPWRELVHHTFLLSCRDLGPEEPDPRTVHTALAAYVEAGGVAGAADEEAFAGLAGGLLHWLESNRRAAAHDPTAAAALSRAGLALPAIVAALPRWAALLR